MTNVELYGEAYASYVWVYLSHFSLYGVAGVPHNRAPNVTAAHPSVDVLWPPDNKYVDVSILGVTDPDGDEVTITIMAVTSDESPVLERGSGGKTHDPNALGVGTDTASLRAERSGVGNGRVYVVHFLASDGKEGETEVFVVVQMPHDVKKGIVECVDDGQLYDATLAD